MEERCIKIHMPKTLLLQARLRVAVLNPRFHTCPRGVPKPPFVVLIKEHGLPSGSLQILLFQLQGSAEYLT